LWSTFCFSCLLDNFTMIRFHSLGIVKFSHYMIIDEIKTLWAFHILKDDHLWLENDWTYFVCLLSFFFCNNAELLSFSCMSNSFIRWSCKNTILKHMGLHTGMVGIALLGYWRLKEYGSWIFSSARDKIITKLNYAYHRMCNLGWWKDRLNFIA
jgi:hypothetical protein